jgi:mannose-6-phosphate isomerase-like protein (cupin superfamily)
METGMSATIVGPQEGKAGHLGAIGVRFMASGAETGGGFSLVEHPMAPRALAAPLHRHSREDEYSYVLEGRMGADLGGEIVVAEAGDLVFKPRGQWHSFWNAGDEPARILEIISPAGFERYFEELIDLAESGGVGPDSIPPIAARYGLEIDFASLPVLCERHGVRFPAEPV